MSGQYGFATKLGIDTANPVTKRFDFQSEGLKLTEEFKDTNGLRGTRSRSVERVRAGLRRPEGPLSLQPNSLEMTYLLAWILGGSPSGSGTVTYPLGDSLSTRYITIDRGAKVYTYSGCVVDRATFKSSQGEPLSLELEIVGVDETEANSGTFPAISIDLTTQPFMFHDLALTVAATEYDIKDIELVIDNKVDRDRFFNNQTRTAIIAQDRMVSLNFNAPHGDSTALYNTGAAGVAATAVFTNGSAVLSMSMAKVTFPRESPTVPGRSEVMLPMRGTAWKSGTTLELVTTLNPGP